MLPATLFQHQHPKCILRYN